MTEDMSELYKARQEIKLSRICFRAVKGALHDGLGRIDADLNVPVRQLCLCWYLFHVITFPPLAEAHSEAL